MTNFADFKAAIEGISGGKNTALLLSLIHI